MKLENTLSNKAKFFAQYFKQKVLYRESPHDELIWVHGDELEMFPPDEDEAEDIVYLELTPLQNITDEDAIEICKILNEQYSKHTRQALVESFNEALLDKKFSIPIEMTDFLRSKSYALPYLGLSINEQIEYGWITLKQ